LNDLLTILQHADSAFPSGSFAFSNGIEGLAAMNAPLDRSGLRAMKFVWNVMGSPGTPRLKALEDSWLRWVVVTGR
jgi:hypothetical protein